MTDRRRRRRTTRPHDDGDLALCPCGSGWFEVKGGMGKDQPAQGAVCVSSNGAITGYAGQLHCTECGGRWQSSTPRLRVVD